MLPQICLRGLVTPKSLCSYLHSLPTAKTFPHEHMLGSVTFSVNNCDFYAFMPSIKERKILCIASSCLLKDLPLRFGRVKWTCPSHVTWGTSDVMVSIVAKFEVRYGLLFHHYSWIYSRNLRAEIYVVYGREKKKSGNDWAYLIIISRKTNSSTHTHTHTVWIMFEDSY
jgi:hypothetical protein